MLPAHKSQLNGLKDPLWVGRLREYFQEEGGGWAVSSISHNLAESLPRQYFIIQSRSTGQLVGGTWYCTIKESGVSH